MRPIAARLRPATRLVRRVALVFALVMIIAPAAQAVTTTLSVTPVGQSAGGTVTLSGSGFLLSTPVDLSATFLTSPAVVTADGTGAFSGATITVPTGTPAGSYPITATDGTNTATTVLNVDTVAVSPTTGATDAALTVTGAGWPASDEIQIQIAGMTVCQLAANAQGQISGDQANGCRVPPGLSPGTQAVSANDLTNGSGQATGASFTVPTEPPVAAFTPTLATVLAGSNVQFDGAGSSDPDGTITGYSWSFGDGGTSTSAQPSHTYLQVGTFTVSLVVTDTSGNTASVSHQITVIAPPPLQKLVVTPVAAPAVVESGPASTTKSGTVNLGQRGFCPGPGPSCTATIIATSKATRVGRSLIRIGPNRSAALTFKLSRAARALLVKRGRLPVRVTITAKRGSQTATRTLRLTLVQLPR